MTVSYEPVMELIRASMIPMPPRVTPRSELPACQVVLRAAKSRGSSSELHPLHDLAIGVGVAASGMTFWLSQERGTDVEEALARFPHNPDGSENPVRTLLGTLLTGSKGMDASADFLMEFFGQDQDAYMDLIVDLGSYVAACVEILDGLKVSSVEESLEQLEVMLRGFYDAPAEPEF